MANKIKLDPKNNIIILVGGGLMVLVGVFIFFITAFKAPPQQTPTQEVITKNEDKTYQKYIALKEDKIASGSPTIQPPTDTPTPTAKVSPTGKSAVQETLTPAPTEIILAVDSPTAAAEAQSQTTSAPTQVASLPTTGNITGSIFVFIVSLSMIAFAFVL